MSAVVVHTSELGRCARCSSVNQIGSLMATVHPSPKQEMLSIHTSDQGTGWAPSGCCPDDLLSKHLLPGEQLVALDWAHPQFGNLLAVGTSQGRVLLVTNRPAISDLTIERPKWHLCCVLLGIDKIHTRCKVTAAVDWICVCADLEDTSGIREKQDAVSGVAWAPLMARKAECIAVARGSTVRLLALGGQLQGHINANENLQAYQVGEDAEHDAPVWKLQWSNLGLDLAVSCTRTQACAPAVHIRRTNLAGELEPEPAAVIVATSKHC